MSETEVKRGPCLVCKGSYAEHFDENGKPKTKHVYTEEEGVLETQEQQNKRLRRSQPTERRMLAQTVDAQPNSVGRLVEVMLTNGQLSSEEALYIAGMGSRPIPRHELAKGHPLYRPGPGTGI